MPQAEYLDLITNVRDQFSDDLLMLSGQLQTAGRLADQLDPIRIRVRSRDRQLDQTLSKMTALEALDKHQTFSLTGRSGVSEQMDWLFGEEDPLGEDAFTFDTTASDILEDSLTDLSETVNETREQIDTDVDREPATQQVGSVQQMTVGTVGAITVGSEAFSGGLPATATNILSGSAVTDGGGRRRSQGLSSDVIRQAQQQFGLDIMDERVLAPDLSPAHFFDGSPLFQMTPDELGRFTSPRAMHRALDIEGILDSIHFLDSTHELAGATFSDLLRNIDGGIDADQFFDQFFDTRTLRWEQLKESFFQIRIGMTQFYDFLAALMPLMFVFIGAMPAVISALTGLGAAAVGAAGGLASIAGLGLMGRAAQEAGGRPGLEDITDVLSDIPDEFFEAFRGVADRLAPLFDDALGGLSRLFDELALRFDRILTETGIRDMATAFGQWLIPFIANTTDKLVRLGDAARPVFSMMSDGLGDRDIIAGLAGSLANVLPQLIALTGIVLNALPTIARFSAGMADMLTNIVSVGSAVGGVAVRFAEFIPFVDDGARALGVLTAGFFSLMSATFLATKIAAIFRADLMKLIIAKAAATNWSTLLSSSLYKQAGAMVTVAAKSQLAAIGVTSLAGAFKALMAATGIGALLVAAGYGIMQLTDWFIDLEGNVTDATNALREFERQQSQMGGYGDGVYTGSLDSTVYVDVTDTTDIDINGGNSATSDAEYANYIDNSRMDQIFS